ncbi:hypothetical protein [Amycolatopsis rifamycinica]|uniref:hypothetical protein n=1 Tax=Amycolatopsis rifamycinica TaxID=287986 RepID=UPI00126A1E9F|nr:hypothetical protein [Amycolatopsis rifamycinica]
MTVLDLLYFSGQQQAPTVPTPSQPSVVLQNLSSIGTFIAAVANVGLVVFALVQLWLLRRQVNLAQDQTKAATEAVEAARDSVDASRSAVVESARIRVDERAPRVVALMEAPRWPALIDETRSMMPGGGELRLWHHRSLAQSAEASPAEPFVFPRDENWFMWFRINGVLVNEGAGTARVRLDGEAHFIEGSSPLIPRESNIPVPPPVGTLDRQEYLLRSGESALFEWAYGHPLKEWADAYENPNPPNPFSAAFLVVTVFDYFEHGVMDHIYIETGCRPIVPVPNAHGQWTVPQDSAEVAQGLTVYPTRRTYRSEPRGDMKPPPWEEVYREWNKKHYPS